MAVSYALPIWKIRIARECDVALYRGMDTGDRSADRCKILQFMCWSLHKLLLLIDARCLLNFLEIKYLTTSPVQNLSNSKILINTDVRLVQSLLTSAGTYNSLVCHLGSCKVCRGADQSCSTWGILRINFLEIFEMACCFVCQPVQIAL